MKVFGAAVMPGKAGNIVLSALDPDRKTSLKSVGYENGASISLGDDGHEVVTLPKDKLKNNDFRTGFRIANADHLHGACLATLAKGGSDEKLKRLLKTGLR